jgi:hypothetical protein
MELRLVSALELTLELV